jgi:hypothetical protein
MHPSLSFNSNDGSIHIASVEQPITHGMQKEVAASALATLFRSLRYTDISAKVLVPHENS